MIRKMLRSFSLSLGALTLLIVFNQDVLAGPPLLCWPFEIGNAKSLPWGGGNWHATRTDYDINRLSGDTLALLTADVPVIVRMETLRRATLYAIKDQRIAAELHSRLAARAQNTKANGRAHALALFDLGYLKEAYKQASHISKAPIAITDPDGYSLVVKAISLVGADPEMEFAAALMTAHPKRDTHQKHLQRAVAGATDGSLLARNLVSHFKDRGATIDELRTNLRAAKN